MTLDDLGDRLFAYVPEVAQILGRDERTVRAAIRAGDIPATKTGQRYIVRVSWLREQAGAPAVSASMAVPDLDELADRVADRVLARFADIFSMMAPAIKIANAPAVIGARAEQDGATSYGQRNPA
jgi:excisionase family DNA binding protein